MLTKYNNKEYNRESIRNTHIEKMKIHRNNLSKEILNIMKKILKKEDRPSLEEITESTKHYHSNNRLYNYTPSYKRQSERELLALKILKLM